LTDDALFIVSAKRILKNPKGLYTYLLDVIHGGGDDGWEDTIERSWMYILGCNDIPMSSRCAEINGIERDCQCFDS
jgi:hypothetical protein